MKMKITAFSAAITVIMICSAHAATLGYIDTQKVISTYEKTRKAMEYFKKAEHDIQAEIAEKQKQVDAAKEKGASNEEIQNIIDRIEKEMEPRSKGIRESKQKIMFEIQNDVIMATEAVSRKMGIEAVLEKQALITGGVDITDKVIEFLNKK